MKALCETTHYNCKTKTICPPKNFITYNLDKSRYKEAISVDACLADEIEFLWRKGIRTAGCCCGHGIWLGFIEVFEEDIPKMEQMGYVHYIYGDEFGGVERKDAFIPKSYGHIYDGYYFTKADEKKEPAKDGEKKILCDIINKSDKDKIAICIKNEAEYYRLFDLFIKNNVKWKSGSFVGSGDAPPWDYWKTPSSGLLMIFDKEANCLVVIETAQYDFENLHKMKVVSSDDIEQYKKT